MLELQTAAKEQQTKYNKVKKALYTMKDKATAELADADLKNTELRTLAVEYEKLVVDHSKLQKTSSEREKLQSKRYEKTKQLLNKTKSDLAESKEKIKEQEKQIAGFTAAADAFDVQMRRAADREKELLEDRNAQETNIKQMLEKMEKLDRTSFLENDKSMMDQSTIMDTMQNLQAILDPDSQSVTLVNMGGAKGKAFKLHTKIKLVNPDASIL